MQGQKIEVKHVLGSAQEHRSCAKLLPVTGCTGAENDVYVGVVGESTGMFVVVAVCTRSGVVGVGVSGFSSGAIGGTMYWSGRDLVVDCDLGISCSYL